MRAKVLSCLSYILASPPNYVAKYQIDGNCYLNLAAWGTITPGKKERGARGGERDMGNLYLRRGDGYVRTYTYPIPT